MDLDPSEWGEVGRAMWGPPATTKAYPFDETRGKEGNPEACGRLSAIGCSYIAGLH